MDWKSLLHADPTDWLLEPSNPSVRYFTLRWLLDLPEDEPQVCAAQEAIAQSAPVQKIFKQMHPAGYWGSDPNPHAGCRGRLLLLTWLGYRGDAVRPAIEYYLNGILSPEGAYAVEMKGRAIFLPCHAANLLRLMLWNGLADDPRTARLMDWLIGVQQPDGVWACISKLNAYPCLWATAVTLRAFRELPLGLLTPQVEQVRQRAIDLILRSNLYRYGKDKPSPLWFKFGYPLQWDSDLLEMIELLAPFISAEDPRIQSALKLVLDKQDPAGRWPAEKDPKGGKWMLAYLPFEELGQPSKWVTLHAMHMLKALHSPDKTCQN
ncbi:MAG TPA: hypothetical protein VMT46_15280 [Anaerolineaceae bacterium]|nr:hypothetical protein [Anaerolineaceae bacterium]